MVAMNAARPFGVVRFEANATRTRTGRTMIEPRGLHDHRSHIIDATQKGPLTRPTQSLWEEAFAPRRVFPRYPPRTETPLDSRRRPRIAGRRASRRRHHQRRYQFGADCGLAHLRQRRAIAGSANRAFRAENGRCQSQASARARRKALSRALRVSLAAASNSQRASAGRPARNRKSPLAADKGA